MQHYPPPPFVPGSTAPAPYWPPRFAVHPAPPRTSCCWCQPLPAHHMCPVPSCPAAMPACSFAGCHPVMPQPHVYYPPYYSPYPATAYFPPQPWPARDDDEEEEEEEGGQDEQETDDRMAEESQDAEVESAEHEHTPFYVLSEEAIALFARSEERRRKERNQKRKQQAKAREEAKKEREARKTGTFVTQLTIGGNAANGDVANSDTRTALFGSVGVEQIQELEGMMGAIYHRACDLKRPVLWPSMPLA